MAPIKKRPLLKRRTLHWAAVSTLALYWTALFVGTHVPNPGQTVARFDDKVLHFIAYAGLAFLLAAALTAFRLRIGTLFWSLVAAAIYGIFDEVSQMFVINRAADVFDWLADIGGAVVGVVVFASLLVSAKRLLAPWYDLTRWTSCL